MGTADDLRALIPTPKKEGAQQGKVEGTKEMARLKELDRKHDFDSSKVRATVDCISCLATRAVYSKYAVGKLGKPAPTEEDLEKLQQSLENDAYTCGSKIKGCGEFFYSRRAMKCGSPIEATYYNP